MGLDSCKGVWGRALGVGSLMELCQEVYGVLFFDGVMSRMRRRIETGERRDDEQQ